MKKWKRAAKHRQLLKPVSRIVQWSDSFQDKTLINTTAVFQFTGVNKLHMRDTKSVRNFCTDAR